VDWNNDNDFNDTGERILVDHAVVAGTQQVTFPIPAGTTFGTTFSLRFRLYPTSTASGAAPVGLITNGEVEDYRWPVTIGGTPTPVTVAYFLAAGKGGQVHFDWSTATEAGNVGFNLYAQTPLGVQRI